MNLIVTGGCGFIGANFIHYWLEKHAEDLIVNVDACTYAAVKASLDDLEAQPDKYKFEKADIADYDAIDAIVKKYAIDIIVNFAAESHNSNSILNPTSFYRTNVLGAQNLMEVTRNNPGVKRLHHISTCEVFGDMALDSETAFTEESPLGGNSPYSSSKAGSNLAANAYFKTFGIPITVSVCSNNYGPYQFPEKLIPLFVTNLIQNRQITLYRESDHKREWLHVRDHCRAIELILENGEMGNVYNIGSGVEKSVEDIAQVILDYFGKSDADKIYVPSRPSHDRRYLLDSAKIRSALGWAPEVAFDDGIRSTIEWYIQHEQWWKPLLTKRISTEQNWQVRK
ncbi:MAG: dTDP-glucose 4,6-dehydratase [Clostridiales bacterium]|nr:dTDP-glucose 4,6-dehydratase [Clostridiales bacterium]